MFLILIIIIICSILSSKIEIYKDNVGTVIDSKINPPNLDVYNCYNYIKAKFPTWNVDNYSKGELKALATLRTGLDPTYQPGTSEPQYTNCCILPDEHSFIYANNTDNNIIIDKHILPRNNSNGIEKPYGFKIDLSQPNQLTGIDYSKENNFRDLLKRSHLLMDNQFITTISTLSNQIWYSPGLSNIYVDYLTKQIPSNKRLLNNSIVQYKSTCLLDNYTDTFNTECDNLSVSDPNNRCCNPNSICLKALKTNNKLTNCINENNDSISIMQSSINQIRNTNIDQEIARLQNVLNLLKNNVIFYIDCDYQGGSSVRGIGSYSMDSMGLPNDFISSIRIPSGFYVKVFEDANYSGNSMIFNQNVNCLVNYNWNDSISSFIIRNSPFPIPVPPPPIQQPAPIEITPAPARVSQPTCYGANSTRPCNGGSDIIAAYVENNWGSTVL
jgi:hypothetical protein